MQQTKNKYDSKFSYLRQILEWMNDIYLHKIWLQKIYTDR